MEGKDNITKNVKLDKPLFFTATIFTGSIMLYAALMPESALKMTNSMFHWVTRTGGSPVLILSLVCLFVCIWLSFSKYGKIKFGGENVKPDFKYSTFCFMMFTAAVGSSLIYWAMGEPMIYINDPPMFTEPNTPEAARWIMTYPLFHWGPTGWAIWMLPGIPFAYFLWNRKNTDLRVSTICSEIIGKKRANGAIGFILNILTIFGAICGVASSIGFNCSLTGAGIEELFGIPNTMMVQVFVVLVFIAFFSIVIIAGIEKGVSKVSDMTVYVAFALVVFIFIVSNSTFIMNFLTDSVGVMIQNYFAMSLWTDPVAESGFPQDWTVYYWLWYYAYLLIMGLFVAKIAKGRTIRQVVLTGLIFGTLGCTLITGVFGGFACYTHFENVLPLQELITEVGTSGAVIKLIRSLPLGTVALVVFLIVEFLMMATTLSGCAYSLSLISAKNMSLDAIPSNSIKIAWAIAVGGMSMVALFMGGSIGAIKNLCVVGGFPLMVVMILITTSLIKWLKKDIKTAKEDSEGNLVVDYKE